MLERLVETMDRHPKVGLVYADWETINSAGKIVSQVSTYDYDPYLLMRINYINACFLYRSVCQEVIGSYDPNYLYVEDWEYWLRLSKSFGMFHLNEVLYQYRIHPGSLTETRVIKHNGKTDGMKRLDAKLRSHRLAWYLSKIKYELLRFHLGKNPKLTAH
jgi:hypothetical protein